MNRIEKSGSLSGLIKEVKELIYRVKYLGHHDELSLNEMENLVIRLMAIQDEVQEK